ncbi:hypothetical protein TcWFU_006093 [Taenia crassiceps]|uniref:Uncharacterized protein n=1 Tax=Taenia crassiceps TaxID=6207 RepID=A0ABR4Q417_9CEST
MRDSSDSSTLAMPKTGKAISGGERKFDSPSGITVWPYYDLARCEARCVVKNAIRIAETIFQSGFIPQAESYHPVTPVTTKPWPLCEPKSYALDPPFHTKPIPGSNAFEYVSPKPLKARILVPASTEVAKNPLSLSGRLKPLTTAYALCQLNSRNAGNSPQASSQL